MTAQAPQERFAAFLGEYAVFLEELSSQTADKHAALASGQLERMDRAMVAQQSLLMRLERMEQQREALQREAGWDGLKLKDILSQCVPEQAALMRPLLARIQKAADDIGYYNGRALELARDGLRAMGAQLPAAEGYTPGGREKAPGAPALFETKI